MNDEAIARYKAAFDKFDVNKDGRINKDEVRKSLKSMGFNPTEEMVERIIKDGDKNNDGWIEWNEVLQSLKRRPQKEHNFLSVPDGCFCQYLSGINPYDPKVMKYFRDAETRAALRARFRLLDRDNSGYLTADEIRDAIAKTGADVPAERADDMIRAADRNHDGRVTYEEFLSVM